MGYQQNMNEDIVGTHSDRGWEFNRCCHRTLGFKQLKLGNFTSWNLPKNWSWDSSGKHWVSNRNGSIYFSDRSSNVYCSNVKTYLFVYCLPACELSGRWTRYKQFGYFLANSGSFGDMNQQKSWDNSQQEWYKFKRSDPEDRRFYHVGWSKTENTPTSSLYIVLQCFIIRK